MWTCWCTGAGLAKDSCSARDDLPNLPCLGARFVLRLTNFINVFLFFWQRLTSARYPNQKPPGSQRTVRLWLVISPDRADSIDYNAINHT